MLEYLNSALLVEALGLALLHSLWQGVLIGLVFKIVLSAMTTASPQSRYLASVAALALLAASVPLTTVYLLAAMQPIPDSTAANAAASIVIAESARLGTVATPAGLPIVVWTVVLWVIGVAVVATRTLLSWRRLSGLRRTADIAAASSLAPVVERLCGVFGLSGKITIGLSASIVSPMIIGWIKPMILLPPAVAARLPREQLEMIIAHELAHLRRQDHWINLFQVATETLMFYHPVVGMVSRRIRIERENACDDLAVAATRRRLDYVEMLAALERQRGPGPALALGVQDGQVVARIRRLVERSEPGNSRGAAIPALIALAAVAGLLAAPLIDNPEADKAQTGADLNPPPSLAAEPGEQSSQQTVMNGSVDAETVSETRRPDPRDSNLPQPIEPVQDKAAEIATPSVSESGPATREQAAAEPAEPEPAATAIAQGGRSSSSTAADRSLAPAPVGQGTQAEASSEVEESAEPAELADARAAMLELHTPQVDPGALLASRSEIPVLLPEDAAIVAEQPRPLNGDARRAASVVFAGGELLRDIQPAYPKSALRRDISGSVEVELKIDTDGRVADVSVLSELPANAGFGAAARQAASNWRFEPFTKNGDPVEQRKTVVFDFEPGDGCRMVTGTRLPSC